LASAAQTKSILSRLYGKHDIDYLEAEPFFSVVVLKALRRAGRTDLALRLIRDRWGKRMLDAGMTSVTEEWHASMSRRGPGRSYTGIYRSLSHAWSGCAAEFLVRQLAGFEILEPGARKVRLDPVAADFDYAVGIPVPTGQIQVRMQDGKPSVQAPEGVSVEIPG
jgi:hypothetical protein